MADEVTISIETIYFRYIPKCWASQHDQMDYEGEKIAASLWSMNKMFGIPISCPSMLNTNGNKGSSKLVLTFLLSYL